MSRGKERRKCPPVNRNWTLKAATEGTDDFVYQNVLT